ncbi:thiamine pyrophosphate central domain-containing protein [Caldalkalibacillus thermarum TA2.A1]|uniref:3D-(3,5/4)-trihydroxycyclohexane-1,2-dione acylhydrolase (Decyclizing) n=1 Tax=Caldalkalibacillus thermarum (strain TA2.A1) TaxID=986075 RepID=F5L486_CALTT|nr:3D-(3,5/4)-trihydroxycyclohexane-1,2-dione acylhydrolase (decyclizing) [Caldalkalibacillus thermarum]EGL83851.1 thiamine pyrophosphate central domain-containing protein [Caldalkalibacillus thermarum TA2.A1]QZT34100.1 3D-(3,5/4)-trihydroxycyclohexane-1,2-dione acylhydrolase (decyclizing) [Caldalkalibacillus thermarum TA2.A1]
MQTIRLTMAQALLKFLDNQYVELDGKEYKFVKGVMGIFGHGNVTGLGEALEHHRGELTYIQGKNEQGMVHAATAFAKQKNRLQIFACTSSIGPGAMNMVTGAATATVNRIPVLLLPGDIFANRQPDPVLQQIEDPTDYTVTANDAFKPVSKYWDRITRPEQLMTAALNAMRVLTDPAETGAVTLALPQDVQCEAYDYPIEFFDKRVHHIERRPITAAACNRAVEVIRRKKKPVIIAGGGVHYSFATETLQTFAETFNIPVMETQAGKSALPWDHPLNMGGVGVTGTLAANVLAKEADLVIAVGTRLSDFTTASKTAFQNPDLEILSINVSPMDAMKMNAISVVADAKSALETIQEALQNVNYQSAYETTQLQALKAKWNEEVDRLYSMDLKEGLSQTRVLGEINRFIDEEDIIVCAAGGLPGDLHRLWRSKKPKTYHMEYGFSCMGYEVTGAFGVKLAEPEREVYALVGDGSYLMLHSELVTSLQEGRKITVLLFDNHGFQCIHNLQRAHGSDGFGNEFRYRSEETNKLTGDYLPIDFAQHARSMGAKAYTARTVEELREALKKAKQEKVSTLIDIKVLPGTNTDGYESWWRVGVAEVSASEKVTQAYQEMVKQVQRARQM